MRRVDDEIALTLLEEQHAAELFRLVDANRAYLRQWLPWLDQNTRVEHTAAFIQGSLRQFAARDGLACGIRFRGALAGVAGIHRIDWPNRRTSLGYWLAETHERKGLVTRACTALLDYVFGDLGLNHVEIACAPANIRSCAIAERLGFTREAVLRQREWLYDHFVDHVVYGMLAVEWAARAPGRPPTTKADAPSSRDRPDGPSTPRPRAPAGSPQRRGARARGRRRPPT
jgi:ribosomal-protein-serine acetyltransferase